MILYHGSNVEIREPQLLKIQRDLDFGKGFYTTSDLSQAKAWAKRSALVRKNGLPSVSCYELDDMSFSNLNINRFEKADKRWLDFVASNRRGTSEPNEFDLIIGPVANDQTFPTLLLYLDGFVDEETTIKNLLTQRLTDQYVFKTERALSHLRFIEVNHI